MTKIEHFESKCVPTFEIDLAKLWLHVKDTFSGLQELGKEPPLHGSGWLPPYPYQMPSSVSGKLAIKRIVSRTHHVGAVFEALKAHMRTVFRTWAPCNNFGDFGVEGWT